MNTADRLTFQEAPSVPPDAGISDEIITGRGYVTIRLGRNPDSVRRNLKDEFGIWVEDARQLSGILIPLWGTQSYREPCRTSSAARTLPNRLQGQAPEVRVPDRKPPVLTSTP